MTTYYTKDHEWIRVEGDTGTVGITTYAAGQLGDVVYVELPEPGSKFARGDDFAVVESVKAASDVYAPVSGSVVEVNAGDGQRSGRRGRLVRAREARRFGRAFGPDGQGRLHRVLRRALIDALLAPHA